MVKQATSKATKKKEKPKKTIKDKKKVQKTKAKVEKKTKKEVNKDFLPGQKKPRPDENDPRRIFYTSLLSENPDSKMALNWLLQHGLLPKEQAQKLVKKQEKLKKTKTGKK